MKFLSLLLTSLLFCLTATAQVIEGSIDADDPVDDRGSNYVEHAFEASEGQMVTIALNSVAFDPYLTVISPSGEVSVNDDFDGPGSKLELLTEEAGEFEVQASSYGGSTGSYTLTIDLGAVVDIERTEGRLDPRDDLLPKGEAHDIHEIKIDTKTDFSIQLRSYGFDGFLVVTAPSGRVWRNDDFTGPELARVGPLEPQRGTWEVIVTSLATEEYGAYDLEIITERD